MTMIILKVRWRLMNSSGSSKVVLLVD
ncbi:hypothetical protein A2U01_0109649, partial [Trifolium medium]|nr:hypothetical protein [Trifolium medium]